MQTLIDGYNLMHALGLMNHRFGPDGFRQARQRFLNHLAAALGPLAASQTTVVFDAASEPAAKFPRATSHKGISVIFAVEDDDADERIVDLIGRHSAPKALTVVSSDHRIRQAATRRKARALSADDFLSFLEARRRPPAAPSDPKPAPRERDLSPAESAYWLNEFQELAEESELLEALDPTPTLLTDAEIAAIEREIEEEG